MGKVFAFASVDWRKAALRLPILGLAVFLLAACIDVDDFGEAWSKTTVDPALAGRWVALDENGEKPTSQEYAFTLKDGAYSIDSYVKGQRDESGPLYPVKTLEIGKYKFLANGPDQGVIIRYAVEGDGVVWYVLNPKHAWEFIQKKFPDTDSFYLDKADDEDDPDAPKSPKGAKGDDDDVLRIRHFDDTVFMILAQIPDTEYFWEPDTAIQKVP